MLQVDLTEFHEFGYQGGPFLAENIGACERAVTADDNQSINARLDQILCRLSAALARTEGLAARRADDRAAHLNDPADRIPIHLTDVVTIIHKSLIAFINRVYLRASIQRGTNHSAHRGVHTLCVAAAGQYSNSFCHILPVILNSF